MPWTSRDEKEILKEWVRKYAATEHTERYLSKIQKDRESYWEKFDSGNDILEYSFENIKDLENILTEQMTETHIKEIIVPLSVAILKSKLAMKSENSVNKDVEEEQKIPEFIYVF